MILLFMAATTKKIITAEEIKAGLAMQSKGEQWLPSKQIETLTKNNKELELDLKEQAKQIEKLQDKLSKQKGSSASIRDFLDTTLKKYGITAAFEPLIEMATERYPDDFTVEALRGQFVLDPDQRIKIWTEILSYQLPKLKAMEVSGHVDNSLTVFVKRYTGGSSLEEVPTEIKRVEDVEATVTKLQDAGLPDVVTRRFTNDKDK